MLSVDTPWVEYAIKGVPVAVKREDLCCPPPGPGFSKVRGVLAHLNKLKAAGLVDTVAVVDSIHSKAGWGVSYLAGGLNFKTIVYYPYTKVEGIEHVRPYQRICRDRFGAELRPLRATKSAVLWYQARKDLAERNPGAYLFPNGLKLNESIEETCREVLTTPPGLMNGTWVVSVSSGTIAKGIAKALAQIGFVDTLVLHMGYSRSHDELLRYTGEYLSGYKVEVVDEGYGYADKVEGQCPFPCNPWYDLKAWNWLVERSDEELAAMSPIRFWNVGN